jgi:hypothetical protein
MERCNASRRMMKWGIRSGESCPQTRLVVTRARISKTIWSHQSPMVTNIRNRQHRFCTYAICRIQVIHLNRCYAIGN